LNRVGGGGGRERSERLRRHGQSALGSLTLHFALVLRFFLSDGSRIPDVHFRPGKQFPPHDPTRFSFQVLFFDGTLIETAGGLVDVNVLKRFSFIADDEA
jgi:hypothetical protein